MFGRYPIAQELGYPVQSLGAVCHPLLVQEEEADRLRDAQRCDSKIVVLESQGDVANYQCDNPANRRGGPQAQEEPQVDSQVQERDFRPVAAELEVFKKGGVGGLGCHKRRRVRSKREETGYANVEQAGVSPMDV